MASGNAVWGIDIGQCALKAVKLRPAEGGQVEAVAFDVIEHSKILSQPDADRDELISSALEKFASRNDWQGDRFMVGVPGQQTFARFCKMPPIDLKKDAKKIHDLVRYEASQQIPFDIDDVVWDYQVFTSEGSPDVEVGIFAIRKDLIRKHLSYFGAVGIAPVGVQTIPAALYNFCHFDGQIPTDGGATVLVDVGAQNTDLIISEPNSAWTRNIPLGGNSFTEALVRAFKLSFAKAESLKRSAADSKYARQIFQAMRPVFADLVAEIQRSIGFYSSTHRDMELKRVIALGNAFRLPGLLKYLENNLTISGGVGKLEKFAKLVPSATINAPQFSDNVLSFGAAYGLALQGLGLAKIRASLLPTEMARIAVWQKKRPYFIATAASLALAAGVPWIANALDKQALASDAAVQARSDTQRTIAEAKRFGDEFKKARTDTGTLEQDSINLTNLQQYKRIVPQVLAVVHEAMPEVNPPDLAQATSGEQLKKLIQSDRQKYARTERGQLMIESFKLEYTPDVAGATLDSRSVGARQPSGPPPEATEKRGGPPGQGGRQGGPPKPPGAPPGGAPKGPPSAGAAARKDGFVVRIKGRLLQGRSPADAVKWLTETYLERLREQGQQPGLGFFIPPDDPKLGDEKRSIISSVTRYQGAAIESSDTKRRAGESATGSQFVDPVTGEDASTDWRVEITCKVQLGEMPPPAKPEEAAAPPGKPGQPGAPPGGKPGQPAAPPKK
jgi:type IV pilus assembly protein PilM